MGVTLEDLTAKAEFHEIKERVISEVALSFSEVTTRTELSLA